MRQNAWDLITEKPPKTQERCWISHNAFSLRHDTIEIRFRFCTIVHLIEFRICQSLKSTQSSQIRDKHVNVKSLLLNWQTDIFDIFTSTTDRSQNRSEDESLIIIETTCLPPVACCSNLLMCQHLIFDLWIQFNLLLKNWQNKILRAATNCSPIIWDKQFFFRNLRRNK